MERGAGAERVPEVSHEGVEAEAGVGGGAGLRAESGTFGCVADERGDVALRQHTSFRRTCGSAGIEQDKEVVGSRGAFRLSGRQLGDLVGEQNGTVIFRDQFLQARVCDQQRGIGVFYHEIQSLGRVGRVEGLVGAAGFNGSQGCDHHLFAATQDDGNDAAGFHGLLDFSGQVVGEAVCFGIGQTGAAIDYGQLVRRLCQVFLEQVEHRLFDVEFG